MARSPYVLVYNKETGVAQKIYRATLAEFLADGRYTLEAPSNAKADPALNRSQLPTAGREATRNEVPEIFPGNIQPKVATSPAQVAPKRVEAKPEVQEAPVKPAPKRRAPSAEKSEE